MTVRKIEPSDIIATAEYAKLRADRRRQIAEVKKNRRLEVGPFATFYFESFDTMLHQVHEMLFIEKGGAEQLPDELAAYNPLIPTGSELVATVMFEIDDPLRRARVLGMLGGVEHKVSSGSAARRSAACRKTTRNARARTARPPLSSSSAFRSPRRRSQRSAAAPPISSWASIMRTTATWR
jgi:hypothetical protein